MMDRNERMAKLNNAGINTGKYFTLDVSEAIPAGAKIHIVVDEQGNYVPKIVSDTNNSPVIEQIIEDGYVRNTKLHRRFVMAQMFHMLNWVSYDGKHRGYNEYLKKMYDYKYTFDMMLEEIRVLSKLEVRDAGSFIERSHFFNKVVVAAVLKDYLEKLQAHVNALPSKNCKGVPYKTVKGVHIFDADLEKKLYRPIRDRIWKVNSARSYAQIHRELVAFMRHDFVKLPYNTTKSKAWVDAFKGAGAYYTLKNLIMFHDCKILAHYAFYTTEESMAILKQKLDEYKGEGWRMFALMKKVIEDNNFDFYERMRELNQ